MRKQPRFRKKLIIIRELLLHFIQVSGQIIFPCNLIHSWKMIYLLKWLHFFPFLQCWSYICPLDVPFYMSIPWVPMTKFPIKILFTNVFYHIIYCVKYVKNYTYNSRLFDYMFLLNFLFLLCRPLLWFLGRCPHDSWQPVSIRVFLLFWFWWNLIFSTNVSCIMIWFTFINLSLFCSAFTSSNTMIQFLLRNSFCIAEKLFILILTNFIFSVNLNFTKSLF